MSHSCAHIFSWLVSMMKNVFKYFGNKEKSTLTEPVELEEYQPLTTEGEAGGFEPAEKDFVKKVESTQFTLEDSDTVLHKREWLDLPVPMKRSQAVFHNGSFHIGGGFTGNSKTDAVIYVHSFDPSSPKVWKPLPPSPFKWSALSVFNNQLVLIGGREMTHPSSPTSYTNKVVAWNTEKETWEFSLPTLMFPRVSPVAISHRDYLIVAGGDKGVLDYHVEVLNIKTMQWIRGPNLPLPCFAHTSTVIDGSWYLVDQESGKILHTSIDVYIEKSLKILDMEKEKTPEPTEREPSFEDSPKSATNSSIWTVLASNEDSNPTTNRKPLRLFSTTSHLMMLSDVQDLYIYRGNSWEKTGGKFPFTMSTGSWVENELNEDSFLLLGGENGHKYSNSTYKLTVMTRKELAVIKKSRKIRISQESKD